MKRFQLIIFAALTIALASCNDDEPLRVYESANTASTYRSGFSSRSTADDADTADADADIPTLDATEADYTK